MEHDKDAAVRGLHLDEDLKLLRTVQGAHVVRWELDPERLVEMACGRAGRSLTTIERQQLGLGDEVTVCAD